MAIHTLLTQSLGIRVPIILAPMAGVAGGALAAAVSRAGGLGLIGGGYGDSAWVERQWELAEGADVGIGFINWKLREDDRALRTCLNRGVRAVLLSFGDIAPFAADVKASGAKLIAQVQTLEDAKRAAEAGADVIVAQGTEAGGHSGSRATLPFVPAVVDAVGNIPVVAAGGIADGRGLAAALMLGASGVMCGSAFYPCHEALSHAHAKQAALAGSGDHTSLGRVFDLVRGFAWPDEWKLRTLRNDFIDAWENREGELADNLPNIAPAFVAAVQQGDMRTAPTIVGEAADLLRESCSAADLVARIFAEAEAQLKSPHFQVS
jgi:nitronate monooxygenase